MQGLTPFETYAIWGVLVVAILGLGYAFPLTYLIWSLRYGKRAPDNPWDAPGLEWQTSSPSPLKPR